MAITTRTLFKSPLILLATLLSVGAVTLMAGFTLFCFAGSENQYIPEPIISELPEFCSTVSSSEVFSERNEADWVAIAYCFGNEENHDAAAATARDGLSFFPRSETLYNIRGYHLIESERYAEAITVLRLGLQMIGTPSNGDMENNLAWAALWERQMMDVSESRLLYTRSLQRNSTSCETIHTGMWVEYLGTMHAQGAEREFASRSYRALRHRYNGCEVRSTDDESKLAAEVIGVVMLDYQMNDRPIADHQKANQALLRATAGNMISESSELCKAASPFAELRTSCEHMVNQMIVRR